MFRRILTTLAALTCLEGVTSLPAQSASLKRTADGRVIITILGERMAFREADANNVRFGWDSTSKVRQFSKPDSCLGPNGRKIGEAGATLRGWMNASPEVAKCIEQTFPDEAPGENDRNSAIAIRVRMTMDGDMLYPGGIDTRTLEPGDRRGYSLGFVLHDPWYRENYPKYCASFDTDVEFDSGFLGQKNRKSEMLILPTAARLGDTGRPMCISCSIFVDPNPTCHIIETSLDGEVGVQFYWVADHFDRPPLVFKNYDLAVRKIAQSIFIDRPPGDFQ